MPAIKASKTMPTDCRLASAEASRTEHKAKTAACNMMLPETRLMVVDRRTNMPTKPKPKSPEAKNKI